MLAVCHVWFRPILSELIGSALESSEVNRSRAPSGPAKVLVTDRPHRRTTGLVDLTSGASALLAWFPASWAAKLLPNFLRMPLRMRRNHKKSTSHARNVGLYWSLPLGIVASGDGLVAVPLRLSDFVVGCFGCFLV